MWLVLPILSPSLATTLRPGRSNGTVVADTVRVVGSACDRPRTVRTLQGLGFDDIADRGGVLDILARARLGRSLARVVRRAIRIAFTVIVIFAAAQIAISTLVGLIMIGTLFAVAAGTLTIAFGLGSVTLARALSAGLYVRHAYPVGREISFGDVRRPVTTVDSVSTVLDAGGVHSVRIPDQLTMRQSSPSIAVLRCRAVERVDVPQSRRGETPGEPARAGRGARR